MSATPDAIEDDLGDGEAEAAAVQDGEDEAQDEDELDGEAAIVTSQPVGVSASSPGSYRSRVEGPRLKVGQKKVIAECNAPRAHLKNHVCSVMLRDGSTGRYRVRLHQPPWMTAKVAREALRPCEEEEENGIDEDRADPNTLPDDDPELERALRGELLPEISKLSPLASRTTRKRRPSPKMPRRRAPVPTEPLAKDPPNMQPYPLYKRGALYKVMTSTFDREAHELRHKGISMFKEKEAVLRKHRLIPERKAPQGQGLLAPRTSAQLVQHCNDVFDRHVANSLQSVWDSEDEDEEEEYDYGDPSSWLTQPVSVPAPAPQAPQPAASTQPSAPPAEPTPVTAADTASSPEAQPYRSYSIAAKASPPMPAAATASLQAAATNLVSVGLREEMVDQRFCQESNPLAGPSWDVDFTSTLPAMQPQPFVPPLSAPPPVSHEVAARAGGDSAQVPSSLPPRVRRSSEELEEERIAREFEEYEQESMARTTSERGPRRGKQPKLDADGFECEDEDEMSHVDSKADESLPTDQQRWDASFAFEEPSLEDPAPATTAGELPWDDPSVFEEPGEQKLAPALSTTDPLWEGQNVFEAASDDDSPPAPLHPVDASAASDGVRKPAPPLPTDEIAQEVELMPSGASAVFEGAEERNSEPPLPPDQFCDASADCESPDESGTVPPLLTGAAPPPPPTDELLGDAAIEPQLPSDQFAWDASIVCESPEDSSLVPPLPLDDEDPSSAPPLALDAEEDELMSEQDIGELNPKPPGFGAAPPTSDDDDDEGFDLE
eukprot:gnl/TRDRNA2_/TRDRNA2_154829_c0_seq4.p1 gnl/TRDRNA2_/TRDRNA2_154829_c0~~gnl/TRDRNA2_/TRDRNA2_154829_c0_seq4.p1  ORF type:complete len:777 (+),score=171.16 gnl/TRDRNA2_/TRDRNA2_154829_c0_seq4:47-2377(+)